MRQAVADKILDNAGALDYKKEKIKKIIEARKAKSDCKVVNFMKVNDPKFLKACADAGVNVTRR